MKRFFKQMELIGRQWLIRSLALLFGVRSKPMQLPPQPRILVVRLDERVGNLILLTPLLSSLRKRFPGSQIDVLVNQRGKVLLDEHPAINDIYLFDKRRFLGSTTPWAVIRKIRQKKYDLTIDAGNPTGPSTTQAIVVWTSGARNTLGVKREDGAQLFSQIVTISNTAIHEIDLRLELLKALPGNGSTRTVSLPEPKPDPQIIDFLKKIPKHFVILNIGARLIEKQLGPTEYEQLAFTIQESGYIPVVTYGPSEQRLAEKVAKQTHSHLAPPTHLLALGYLMSQSQAVVTCDTGPMHLAVALQTPTFGIFVSTSPERFGYSISPHFALDSRQGWNKINLRHLKAWLRNPADQAETTTLTTNKPPITP